MRYFIIFAVLLFLALGYKTYEQYHRITETQNYILLNEGKALANFISAFRQTYQDAFLENHIEIDEKTINLLPVKTIAEISSRFSSLSEGSIMVRTVSDRPRNPKNKANGFEMNMIEHFRINNKQNYRFTQQENVYHFVQPLRIKPGCLQCHGKREDAIPSIKKRYDKAYGYKIGEIRGLLNIQIQEKDIFTLLYRDFINVLILTIVIYLVFLAVIYLLIRKLRKDEENYTRRLEEEINLKTAELQKQKDLFETLFEKSSDGILIFDGEKFSQCNEHIVQMLGLKSKNELLEMQPSALSPEYQPDGQSSYEKSRKVMQKAFESGREQLEWLHRRSNGEEFISEITLTPIVLDGKRVLYVVWRDISEKKKAQKKLLEQTDILKYRAYHDLLTGLPNRNLFNEKLEQAIRKAEDDGSELALFFIDLDQFKQINDSLGHDVGDRILKEVAGHLREALPNEYTLSRLGGDEFTVIAEGADNREEITDLAQMILDTLRKPIIYDSRKLYISCSIGISLYPKDGSQTQNLLKYADAAMYKAKEEGRNNFRFYTSEMTEQAYERLVMKADLVRALADEEFCIYYQPQFDGKNDRLIGMEALLRWNHPLTGLKMPDSFLPIAGESGILTQIDHWVARQAMKQLQQWHDEGLKAGHLALNLTISHLNEIDFYRELKTTIEEVGFDPKNLELEITESELMQNFDDAIVKLKQLHKLDIHIAIDDFGTGHSSLAYLKRLPVDKLKIDRSFIEDLPGNEEDAAIVKAIIALAQTLGLDIIAEGVESMEQKEFLIKNGCDQIQGYYYARPMPAEEMKKILLSYHLEGQQ